MYYPLGYMRTHISKMENEPMMIILFFYILYCVFQIDNVIGSYEHYSWFVHVISVQLHSSRSFNLIESFTLLLMAQ